MMPHTQSLHGASALQLTPCQSHEHKPESLDDHTCNLLSDDWKIIICPWHWQCRAGLQDDRA